MSADAKTEADPDAYCLEAWHTTSSRSTKLLLHQRCCHPIGNWIDQGKANSKSDYTSWGEACACTIGMKGTKESTLAIVLKHERPLV